MDTTTVNERITHFRKRALLSQADVAEKLGMKGSSYSQMERRGNVSAERIVALAQIFGIRAEQLLYDEEECKRIYCDKNSGTLPLIQVPKFPEQPEPFVPTNSEISLLRVFRDLSQKDKAEVKEFIQKKRKGIENL